MKINMKALIAEDPNWFVEQIKKVRAFSVLSDKELMYVVSQMRSFYFKAGTTIVNQGEAANLFFIVHKGMVEVSVKKFFFREKQVAILESGDFFGESALVSNSSFKFMLQENPLFRQNMKAVYARRKLQLKNA